MTDEQLSALLRLKRFEQPPAGYYEKLLQDIHRRQRTEFWHRPLWRIALDRLQTYFGEPSLGQLSYAGALAGVAAIGLSATGLLLPAKMARQASSPELAQYEVSSAPSRTAEPVNLLTLENEPFRSRAALEDAPFRVPQSRTASTQQPRYIIDARPASYEATPVSFNF